MSAFRTAFATVLGVATAYIVVVLILCLAPLAVAILLSVTR